MKKLYSLVLLLLVTTLSSAQNPNGRVSLVESFTSSTCPACPAGDNTVEWLLAQPANDQEAVSIKYQMDFPGNGDPYYTDEGGTRKRIYGVSSTPSGFIDAYYGSNTGGWSQSTFDFPYSKGPKANIFANYSIDEANQTVDIFIDVEALDYLQSGAVLHIAIFEYLTNNNQETNGQTQFHHVMKKMVPDAYGTPMPELNIGDHYNLTTSYTFNGNYRLPFNALNPINHAVEHSVEGFSDLGVAVWVQEPGMLSQLNSPAAISGSMENEPASFGPPIPSTPITEDVVLFDDNSGDPNDACQAAVNATELNGKIALIKRGTCDFSCKVVEAQNAGAVGVLIYNNQAGIITMGGGACETSVTIPSMMISYSDASAIINQINGGSAVNATIVNRGLRIHQAAYASKSSIGLEENDIAFESLILYPNPASNSTTVSFVTNSQQKGDLNVYNMLGQKVYNASLNDIKEGNNSFVVPTGSFNNGVFTLELIVGDYVKSRRLIVRN